MKQEKRSARDRFQLARRGEGVVFGKREVVESLSRGGRVDTPGRAAPVSRAPKEMDDKALPSQDGSTGKGKGPPVGNAAVLAQDFLVSAECTIGGDNHQHQWAAGFVAVGVGIARDRPCVIDASLPERKSPLPLPESGRATLNPVVGGARAITLGWVHQNGVLPRG